MYDTKEIIESFSKKVSGTIGYNLFMAECGLQGEEVKKLKGINGGYEIIESDKQGIYRAIYTLETKDYVIVLHAFQKKSKKGGEVPKKDRELTEKRIKEARAWAKEQKL